MSALPKTVRDFVQRQKTAPVADLGDDPSRENHSPYASYWYRAVAGMLLSERVSAKWDKQPNMTDVMRICKEANFNPYLFERIGVFLTSAGVVRADRNAYERGPNFKAFWEHGPNSVQTISRKGMLGIVQVRTGTRSQRPTPVERSGLIELLAVFFGCFRGLALRDAEAGEALQLFSELPAEDLVQAARASGVRIGEARALGWKDWLDAKGRQALVTALYAADWAYHFKENDGTEWIFPSPMGLAVLGLGRMPAVEPLPTDLKVLPNNSVFAGAGLDMDLLSCLFRYCRIKRIDRVLEFQLDRRHLTAMPSRTSPGEELLAVLKDVGPLPGTVAALLGAPSRLGGVIGIRFCSALVKPQKPETLSAIREHPRLKGYLEPKSPPGYLLIKPTSDPQNFVRRCRELGFEVELL